VGVVLSASGHVAEHRKIRHARIDPMRAARRNTAGPVLDVPVDLNGAAADSTPFSIAAEVGSPLDLTVVVPTSNEERNVGELLERLGVAIASLASGSRGR
jgi:hypothetical protein